MIKSDLFNVCTILPEISNTSITEIGSIELNLTVTIPFVDGLGKIENLIS